MSHLQNLNVEAESGLMHFWKHTLPSEQESPSLNHLTPKFHRNGLRQKNAGNPCILW